jgi:cysteinyl-tRNA synthetase
VADALSDDLDFHKARMELDSIARRAASIGGDRQVKLAAGNDLAAALLFLGMAPDSDFDVSRQNRFELRESMIRAIEKADFLTDLGLNSEHVDQSIAARAAARKAKDFAEADRIRAELDALGIALKDSKDPKTGELVTTWEVKR